MSVKRYRIYIPAIRVITTNRIMIVEGENKLYQENVVEEADEMPEHPISQDIVRMIKC